MNPTPDGGLPEKIRDLFLVKDPLSADIAQVLEAAEDGVLMLDRQWRIVYANRNARRLSHIREEHLNGKSHWELYPDTVGTELERQYRRVMQTRVEGRYCFHYEPFDLTTDIRILPVETGIALIYRDLTAQKREEAARLALARQLEQVLAATTDTVVSVDRNWKITFLNRRAQEMLAPSGEILGRNLWECFPEAYREDSPIRQNYFRTMETGVPCRFEVYYPEPLHMWIAIEAQPAEDGIIVFSRDVTEERRTREAMRLKQEESERQRAEIEAVYAPRRSAWRSLTRSSFATCASTTARPSSSACAPSRCSARP